MTDFGPFSVAIAFWVFCGVCAVAGIVADVKKRRAALEPLRAAIEKGQQLDPAVVERLMAPGEDRGVSPVGLMIGGIICISAGVGVGVLAFFLSHVTPVAFYPVFGGGVVTFCIGVGLVVAARAVEAHARRQGKPGPTG